MLVRAVVVERVGRVGRVGIVERESMWGSQPLCNHLM